MVEGVTEASLTSDCFCSICVKGFASFEGRKEGGGEGGGMEGGREGGKGGEVIEQAFWTKNACCRIL